MSKFTPDIGLSQRNGKYYPRVNFHPEPGLVGPFSESSFPRDTIDEAVTELEKVLLANYRPGDEVVVFGTTYVHLQSALGEVKSNPQGLVVPIP